MPVYTVTTEMGRLDEDQRERLAKGITAIHGEETGAPEPLIHVVFNAYPPGVAWSSNRPGSPNIINASVRAGRSQEVRVRMMERMSALFCDVTGISERDVLVALFDFAPHWAMEAGMVLPPTEPEAEAAWNGEFLRRFPVTEG
jgi:phenylpyruvate tautomerase PptA (4-oxalocrotonate tautomerase family)